MIVLAAMACAITNGPGAQARSAQQEAPLRACFESLGGAGVFDQPYVLRMRDRRVEVWSARRSWRPHPHDLRSRILARIRFHQSKDSVASQCKLFVHKSSADDQMLGLLSYQTYEYIRRRYKGRVNFEVSLIFDLHEKTRIAIFYKEPAVADAEVVLEFRKVKGEYLPQLK